MTEGLFVYRVDAENRIVSVNSDWLSFAQANGAPHLTTAAVVGQPLFRFVTGMETQHLTQLIIDRARQTRRTIAIPFRCDSPSVRRFMELVISSSTNDQVEFAGRTIREERRKGVPLFDASVIRTNDNLIVCSWCKRINLSGNWLEVELAVSQMELFNLTRLPRLTHGICADCAKQVRRDIDDAR